MNKIMRYLGTLWLAKYAILLVAGFIYILVGIAEGNEGLGFILGFGLMGLVVVSPALLVYFGGVCAYLISSIKEKTLIQLIAWGVNMAFEILVWVLILIGFIKVRAEGNDDATSYIIGTLLIILMITAINVAGLIYHYITNKNIKKLKVE